MVAFASRFFRPDLIVDSGNEYIRAPRRAFGRGREPRNWAANPFGSFPCAKPFNMPTIPRTDWVELIQLKEKNESHIAKLFRLYNGFVLDQDGTNFCWGNAVTGAVMVKSLMTNGKFKRLSPASMCAQITGYRNQGGYGFKAAQWATDHGIAESTFWPDNYWQSKKYATPEAIANAKLNRIQDWCECEPGNFDQMATCLLMDIPCFIGLNWWGHEVLAIALIALPNGGFGILFLNSWGTGYGDAGIGQMTERKAKDGDCGGLVTLGMDYSVDPVGASELITAL